MAFCDVCSTEVARGDGFLLTTEQVVGEPRYWEHAFKHQWKFYGSMDSKGDSLYLLVRQQVGQGSPWLICPQCIVLFHIDNDQARMHCRQWWSNGQCYVFPGAGPGKFSNAIEAARRGWGRAFGKPPSGAAEAMPLAVSLHMCDRMGIKPTIAPPQSLAFEAGARGTQRSSPSWQNLTDEELRANARDLGIAGCESLSRTELIRQMQKRFDHSNGGTGRKWWQFWK